MLDWTFKNSSLASICFSWAAWNLVLGILVGMWAVWISNFFWATVLLLKIANTPIK